MCCGLHKQLVNVSKGETIPKQKLKQAAGTILIWIFVQTNAWQAIERVEKQKVGESLDVRHWEKERASERARNRRSKTHIHRNVQRSKRAGDFRIDAPFAMESREKSRCLNWIRYVFYCCWGFFPISLSLATLILLSLVITSAVCVHWISFVGIFFIQQSIELILNRRAREIEHQKFGDS